LGIAIADQVGVMANAYYSVISPEGCAAILWKSGEHAAKAADALQLTPRELLRLKLVDAIIEEPLGGAHRDPDTAARNLETWLETALRDVRRLKPHTLLNRRYDRLRNLGACFESTGERPAASAPLKPARAARSAASRNLSGAGAKE
jgi:acetyl-CoA carboxylase carboxyl transferase subunit alpha